MITSTNIKQPRKTTATWLHQQHLNNLVKLPLHGYINKHRTTS